MHHSLSALTLLTATLALAQPAQAQSKATTYAQTITAADLEKHLRVLAADDMEGRETGKTGQKRAAEYIAKQFALDGLQAIVKTTTADGAPSYLQPFNLYQRAWGDFWVRAGGRPFTFLKDFIANGLINVPQETPYETVFVGYGITDGGYDSYAGQTVAGKAVVMLDGAPVATNGTLDAKWRAQDSWRAKAILAKDNGAAQVFIVSAATPDEFKRLAAERSAMLQRFSRLSLKPVNENVGTAGTFLITTDMAAQLLGTTADKLRKTADALAKATKPTPTKLTGQLSLKAERKEDVVGTENVVGFVEGSDKKDEVVVISAHYDHIGVNPDGQVNNGANDDGSGTVSVLEIAQAFAKAKAEGNGPRRSMLFLTVTGEEKGLLGSEYYADFSPVLPLANTVCNLNIDMVGRVDDLHQGKSDNYIYLIGSDKLSSELHQISEAQNRLHTQMELDYKYNDPRDPERIYYRSDHYNFAKHRIPIIFYFNGLHADYHRPGDDVEKIDFKLAERTARLVFYTAWDIANRDARLVVDSNKP